MAVVIATGVVRIRPEIDDGDITTRMRAAGRGGADAFARGLSSRLRAHLRSAGMDVDELGNRFTRAGRRGNAFTRSLGAVGGAVSSMARSFGGAWSDLGRWGKIIVSLIPALGGLVTSLQAIAPAAYGAATGFTAMISAFAVIKMGTSGMGDALKAAFEPGTAAAKSAASSANQHANAVKRVQDATEQAARANADAARRTKSAEDALKMAQKSALAVQKELTQAREDAAMELEDLNRALVNSELDKKEAILAVRQAEENIQELMKKGAKVSQTDRDEAILQLEQARERLKDQLIETDRLEKKTTEANRKGIEGTEAMTQWRDRMSDATANVAEQEQDLADARREQAETAADGQKAIADAMESLSQKTEMAGFQTDKLGTAMSKLSPTAQGFVRQLIAMKPAWDSLKWSIQEKLLRGFATQLQSTGGVVLPVLRKSLGDTANILNGMGLHTMKTASVLAQNGLFGKAMASANQGLTNLKTLPGEFLTALTQATIGGAPAFNALTQGMTKSMADWNQRMKEGLASGELQKRVQLAVQTLKDLGSSLKNVGTIFFNVFGQFQEAGGGFFTTLKEVTAGLAEFTATEGFKEAIKAIADVFVTLAKTALPLVGEIFRALEPVLVALAPPVQQIVRDLGAGLTPIVQALGPVLVAVAGALGTLATSFSPLLVIIGNLIAQLLPPLIPIIDAIAKVFEGFGPIVAMVANILVGMLTPIIEALPSIITPLVDIFMKIGEAILPLMVDLLIQLAPSLTTIGESFGQLMMAIAPILPQLATLVGDLLTALVPLLPPIIGLVAQLAGILADVLASGIQNVIVPAMQILVDLLQGDFSGAWESVKDLLSGSLQWFQDAWDGITGIIQSGVDAVIGIFEYLYDVLIGHSIIPDLCVGIIEWFTGLGEKASILFGQMKDWVIQKLVQLKDKAVSWVSNMMVNILTYFTGSRDKANLIMGQLRDWVVAKAKQLKDWVLHPIENLRDLSIKAFEAAKNGIKTAWDKLQEIAKKPVAFVVNTVYNDGIRKVWNAVTTAFGGKPLAEIKGFARGGVLPGRSSYRSGDDQLVPMRRGEGVYVSEAMQDPYERARLFAVNKAAMRGQSLSPFQTNLTPGFAKGGIFDGIGSAVSGAWDATKKGFGWLADTFGGAVNAGVNAVVMPLINKMPKSPGWAGLLRTGAISLKDSLLGGGKKGDEKAVPNVNYKPSAGVEQWRPVVLQALREVGQSAGLANTTLRRMNQESGGNPTIVNKWDSNWKAGHPSVGLMQVIGPTFAAHAGKYRNKGPFLYGTSTDPLANVYSSMRYALSNYGSLSKAYDRPGGYAKGGVFNPPWVSRDMGGILPDGVSAVNTSGTAEVVSTLDQLKALVASGRGQTYIFNEGAIQLDASKIKSIQDVVDMIDALKVTSRQFGGRL